VAEGHKAVQALCLKPTVLIFGPEAARLGSLSRPRAAEFARLSSINLGTIEHLAMQNCS